MATTRRPSIPAKRSRIPLFALGVLPVGAVLLLLLVYLGRPPRMGADEEVFRTVDALFTAVTARDEKLLGQCEQQLHAQRDAGKMPGEAADHLDGVIAKARGGRWESAARTLYDFMKAQRREGPQRHHDESNPHPRRGAK